MACFRILAIWGIIDAMDQRGSDQDGRAKAAQQSGTENGPGEKPQRQARVDRSAATRDKILDGAYQVLTELGHAGLRSSNISQAAGVSRGGMLHHYPSKEELIAALYVRLMCRLEEESWKIIDSTPDAELIDGIIADGKQRFLSETYAAVLDILVASSEEKMVAETLNNLSSDDRVPARVGWTKRFEDAGVDPALASQITSLIWNAMKGLGIRNVVVSDDAHVDRVAAVARKVAIDICGDVLKAN